MVIHIAKNEEDHVEIIVLPHQY